jgi:hypothetical protein
MSAASEYARTYSDPDRLGECAADASANRERARDGAVAWTVHPDAGHPGVPVVLS